MCKLKSCIVLKDRIFCPDYDSHDRMLSELGVEDTRENAERLFVRVELSPIDDDVFSPINTWRMKVDQDILPDWWVAEAEEPRVREAVAKWAKDHIFCDAKNLDLKNGTYYLKNSRAELYDNSGAKLYGNSSAELYDDSRAELYDDSSAKLYNDSSAELYDDSRAELYDDSRAELYDNSRAELYDNSGAKLYNDSRAELYNNSSAELYGRSGAKLYNDSRAELYNNSRAELYGSSSAKLYDNSRAELYDDSIGIISSIISEDHSNYTLKDNATLKDCKHKVIYQAGDWKLEEVPHAQD